MTLPSWRDWLFSLKAFAASMLALYLAMALSLPRPYWAMATVYVVANPLSGATRSKAAYRVGGTLLGASAAVLLVPLLVDAPVLLSLAVALWTGTLLTVSLLDRTPRSYLFMLSAYSLPMIALPGLNQPQEVFNTAVARSEEIVLGIVCASVVSALVLPGKVDKIFSARIHSWLEDARHWAAGLLSPAPADSAAVRPRLAADIQSLEHFISHLSYDAPSFRTVSQARALRGRMSMLLPVLSSLTTTRQALQKRSDGISDAMLADLGDISEWMGEQDAQLSRRKAVLIQRRLGMQTRAGGKPLGWSELVRAHAVARLQALVNLWLDCRQLQWNIAHPHDNLGWKPAYRHWPINGKARHVDYGMIAFSSLIAAAAIFLACLLWINIGWVDGAGAVIMVAIVSCFFASLDEPVPMMRTFLWGAVVSIAFTTILLFLVIPSAYTFEMLVMMLALPFLLAGTLFTRPQFTTIAMMLTVNTATFLSLQGAYDTDFTAFFNGNVATVAGVLFALFFNKLVRPFGVEMAIKRLQKANWRDLAECASPLPDAAHARLTSRLLDRLGQLIPRLASGEPNHIHTAFGELRVGFAALHLQRALGHLSDNIDVATRQVLDQLGRHFQHQAEQGRARPAPTSLLHSLDSALALTNGAGGRHAQLPIVLHALVELRLTLFQGAPDPARPGEPTTQGDAA